MTHSPSEWAAFLSLGLTPVGVIGFALAFADADVAYFDPRPPLARLAESGRIDPLLVTVGPALLAIRNVWLDGVALLILLTTRPQGAMA